MLMFLLLTACLVVQASGGINCWECRKFGPKRDPFVANVIKNEQLETVESCEETMKECAHNKCYTINYYNATNSASTQVYGCLGRSWFGYYSERVIKRYLQRKGGSDFSGWSTCGSDGCNAN
ncbi:hypothetical protein ACHWQZ_G005565 [Mnemiopsis leidyi]